MNFLTLPKITAQLPAEQIKISELKIPENIKLADPSYASPGKIDILLGAEIFYDVL